MLSEIMKIHPMKLESKLTIKGKARGIPQEYLEWYLHQLAGGKMGNIYGCTGFNPLWCHAFS